MIDFKLKMPIETAYNGEEITKVCVENIYKMLNRVNAAVAKANRNSKKIIKSVHKRYTSAYQDSEGSLIIGRGVSKPCNGDVYNERLGNNIAFMKAKLNANIKKHNVLVRVYNEYIKLLDTIDEDVQKIDEKIMMDLDSLREYNPEYLEGIEVELGIADNEVQEETEEPGIED